MGWGRGVWVIAGYLPYHGGAHDHNCTYKQQIAYLQWHAINYAQDKDGWMDASSQSGGVPVLYILGPLSARILP